MFHFMSSLSKVAAVALCAVLCSAAPTHAETVYEFDKVTIEREGEGRPIFFVPGLSSSPAVFDNAVKNVEGDISKVQIAGFAGTPPSKTKTTGAVVQPVADGLSEFIDTNDLRNVALVGHSLGGVVSLLAASQNDRVTDVLIIDAVPFLPALFNPRATPESAAASRSALRAQMDATADSQYLAIARQGLARQAISEEARAYVYADVERSDLATVKTAFVELMTTDYSAVLSTISANITVLVPFDPTIGFQKEAVSSIYAAQYAGHPNVNIRMIEGSRHFIMLDAPEAFASQLSSFLEPEGE